jgi:colicin import membrane protein
VVGGPIRAKEVNKEGGALAAAGSPPPLRAFSLALALQLGYAVLIALQLHLLSGLVTARPTTAGLAASSALYTAWVPYAAVVVAAFFAPATSWIADTLTTRGLAGAWEEVSRPLRAYLRERAAARALALKTEAEARAAAATAAAAIVKERERQERRKNLLSGEELTAGVAVLAALAAPAAAAVAAVGASAAVAAGAIQDSVSTGGADDAAEQEADNFKSDPTPQGRGVGGGSGNARKRAARKAAEEASAAIDEAKKAQARQEATAATRTLMEAAEAKIVAAEELVKPRARVADEQTSREMATGDEGGDKIGGVRRSVHGLLAKVKPAAKIATAAASVAVAVKAVPQASKGLLAGAVTLPWPKWATRQDPELSIKLSRSGEGEDVLLPPTKAAPAETPSSPPTPPTSEAASRELTGDDMAVGAAALAIVFGEAVMGAAGAAGAALATSTAAATKSRGKPSRATPSRLKGVDKKRARRDGKGKTVKRGQGRAMSVAMW